MAKLRYFIDESQKDRDNLVPIVAVISVKGEYRKRVMGRVKPEDWIKEPKKDEPLRKKTTAQRVKKSPLYPAYRYNGYKEINAMLDTFEANTKEFLRQCIANNIPITPELVGKYLKGEKVNHQAKLEFWEAYDSFLKSGELNLRENTCRCRKTIFNVIKSFQEETGNQVSFENLNLIFFDQLQEYVLLDMECDWNYFATIIKRLKTFLNWATERGYNTNNEYLKFKAVERKLTIVALTEAELKLLFEKEFEKTRDQKIRDIFYFGCKTGLRYIDLKTLNQDHISKDGFIKKIIEKTTYEATIFILPELQKIIDRYAGGYYLLPVSSNQKNNEYLKEVCRAAEITNKIEFLSYPKGQRKISIVEKCDKISSHTARKTFVTLAYASGMSIEDIKRISGIRTESTLRRYLDIDDNHIKSSMEKHLT